MGEQQKEGFYCNQPQKQGFYYNQPPEQGFYYNQQPEGFYYDNQEKGFYYDQQQKGFYYENDEQDNQNPEFKSYWYEYAGRERMLKALNGLRTKVDQWVIQHPHDPTPDQKRAIRDVVTIQCCKDVLKTFMIHVNPDEFFKAGGDPTKLSVLLGKEC